MSLSSFLLGKRCSKKDEDIDGDLDALFRSSVCLLAYSKPPSRFIGVSCVQVSTPRTKISPAPTKVGIKRREDAVEDAIPAPSKRKKAKEQPSVPPKPRINAPATHSKKTKEEKGHKASKKPTEKVKTREESGDEDHEGLEEAYEHKVRPGKQAPRGSSRDDEQLNDTSHSEEDASQLVHETVAKRAQRDRTRPRHIHHIPPDETKEVRDARTIFLGNVPMEVAESKVCPLLFFLASLFSQLPVCLEGLQEIHSVTHPGGQDRVFALPFCRVSETDVCCTRATQTQPRADDRMACDQRR